MNQYRYLVRVLKENFCPECSVRRVRTPQGVDGDCQKKNNEFLIRIDNSLSEQEAIDTLIHEFAHVLSWDHPGDEHGSEWGRAYSRVYRYFLKHIQ